MKIKSAIVFFFAVLSLQAKTILLYNDYSIDISSVDALVTTLKKNHEVIRAADITEFENAFGKQAIDVAILALQDKPRTASEFPAFVNYVTSGGKAIFIDGNRNVSWTKLFGFSYTGRKNDRTVTLLDNTLAESFGSTRQTLYNPGYNTFSMGLEATGKVLAQFDNADAAILFLDGHIMVNGFLLDTDKPYDSAPKRLGVSRASARGSTASLIEAQIGYLFSPPQDRPQIAAGGTQSVTVPLSRNTLALILLLFALSSVWGISRRSA